MKSLLNKIFFARLGLDKFLISGFAFLMGFIMVLISVQVYIKVQEILDPEKNLSGYMILNKEVSLTQTIFGGQANFTKEEIDELREQPFIEDLGVFFPSQFEATATIGGTVGLKTELSFESVPDRFIDELPREFKWSEDSEFVPIIMSQDFLNLYNFSYALARGTPQISKSTVTMVPAKLEVSGPGGTKVFDAKVVGFTQRIPSVIVPEKFMQWANVNIGKKTSGPISRIIFKLKGDKPENIEEYFEEHGWKIDERLRQLARYSRMTNIAMSILFAIGTSIMIFSLTIITMNFALIVTEAKEEIRLLIQLGYKTRYIFRYLLTHLSVFIVCVTIVSVVIFYFINSMLLDFLSEFVIGLTSSVETPVYIAGAIFLLVTFLISLYSIYRVLRRNA